MDIEALRAEKQKIIEMYGVWTDHNIHLGGDLYTLTPDAVSEKWQRILQVVADVAGRPLSDLRILDLACLEGYYAIEFARHGARAVGIEGRQANLEKALFAKRALELDNAEFHLDDVRNLSRQKYGEFDVVLCLGILYHLDGEDVLRFIDSIAEVCTRFAVFDTYVGLQRERSCEHRGRTYWGIDVVEHAPEASREDRAEAKWSSLEESHSLWITRASLFNALAAAGFTSAYQCHMPAEPSKLLDRITVLAMKGVPQQSLNAPRANSMPAPEYPEDWKQIPSHHQRESYAAVDRVAGILPKPLKRGIKSVLRALGLLPKAYDWEGRHWG